MRNIAKCKLCKDIIESFHLTDLVVCKCGEIYVNGGKNLRCGARNFDNFLRVDDQGNEIVVSVKNPEDSTEPSGPTTRKEMLKSLDEMIASIESLPDHAKFLPANQYDILSLLIWISSYVKLLD